MMLLKKLKHILILNKMEIINKLSLKYSEIPKDFCVIRIKDSCNYLHCSDDFFHFKEKMHGCFVCLPEVSNAILKDLRKDFKSFYNLESVTFKDAYNEHGIIEKQIAYN